MHIKMTYIPFIGAGEVIQANCLKGKKISFISQTHVECPGLSSALSGDHQSSFCSTPSLAGVKGGGLAVTALKTVKLQVSLWFLFFSDAVALRCSGACHAEHLWSIYRPSFALSDLNELAA